jgi:thioredoxin 1
MSVIHLDEKNFKKEIDESKIPVIIDFWAPWCGPCQMMGPVFEEVSTKFQGKVKFTKLNTEDHPELAQGFGIRGIPTLIIINKGKEVERLVGFRQKDELIQEVSQLIK